MQDNPWVLALIPALWTLMACICWLSEKGGDKLEGISRAIDRLGRVVVPIEIRKRYGLSLQEEVEIIPTKEGILLRPVKSHCAVCGGDDVLIMANGKAICKDCFDQFADVLKR